MNFEKIKNEVIKQHANFPKEGVNFYDIHDVMVHTEAFKFVLDTMVEKYKDKIDVIVGLESRGYYFGIPLASALAVPFVPLRKPKKLPGEVFSFDYKTEYSTDTIQIQKGRINQGTKVLIVDDLLATGGTAEAAANLIKEVGGEIVDLNVLIELNIIMQDISSIK